MVDVESLVPPDHLLRKIDAVLDLSFVPDAVAECYAVGRGRPSIDPELALRMMLLGTLYDLGDRELCQEIQMHAGMRWFCRLNFHDSIPDHSTLSRLRNETRGYQVSRKLRIRSEHIFSEGKNRHGLRRARRRGRHRVQDQSTLSAIVQNLKRLIAFKGYGSGGAAAGGLQQPACTSVQHPFDHIRALLAHCCHQLAPLADMLVATGFLCPPLGTQFRVPARLAGPSSSTAF